jgi:hypothetical protein
VPKYIYLRSFSPDAGASSCQFISVSCLMSSTSDSQLVTRPTTSNGLVIEAWGEGLMVGSLLVMAAITISNMRKNVLLHKLILAEVWPPGDYQEG